MLRPALILTVAALLSGCSRSRDAGPGNASATGSAAGASTAAVGRGPARLPVDGDPNGLWWDAPTDTLLIADGAHNRVLKWTDGGGIATVAELPPAPPKSGGLGQLVKTPDGRIFVTRFGSGTSGDVVYIAPDGTTGKVPGLDPRKRRIGLTVAADGTLYDAYFIKSPEQHVGAVARLDPAGTETDVLTGLDKPVGVLVSGADLLVSDQGAGTVQRAPLAAPGKATVMAQVPGPDLLCAGPDGSLFTGGTTGEVRQIKSDGHVGTFAGGFSSVRGVAYDAKNRRLFASDHATGGQASGVRVLPVN